MDPQLKQRVVGASVLAAIMVVFIPILFDETRDEQQRSLPVDIEADFPGDFNSRVVPLDDETMDWVEQGMDMTPEQLEQQRARRDPSSVPPEIVALTSAVAATRTGVTAWVVQLGSFSNEQNAIGLIERLQKTGYTAFVEPLRDVGKISYRVRVGPELTKVAAEEIRDKLATDVAIKGIVLRYP